MKESLYHQMAAVEDDHWWFVGRRRIVAAMLDRFGLPASARILEIGCGSGGNLRLLARYGTVWAVDSDPQAITYAQQTGKASITAGKLPDDIPFAGKTFDLVVLLDVLEHVRKDQASLASIHRLLANQGHLLITVPAYKFLWSPHDEIHHHQRRYRRDELIGHVEAAGFTVEKATYYNTLLFPIIALLRWLERLSPGRAEQDLEVPPAPLNQLLTTIFASERHLLGRMSLPFGVSLLLAGRKHV